MILKGFVVRRNYTMAARFCVHLWKFPLMTSFEVNCLSNQFVEIFSDGWQWQRQVTHKNTTVNEIRKRSPFSSVIKHFIWIEPLLRGHLSYEATFSLPQRSWPLNTCLTIYIIFKMTSIFSMNRRVVLK
jgi:hypothetical protein